MKYRTLILGAIAVAVGVTGVMATKSLTPTRAINCQINRFEERRPGSVMHRQTGGSAGIHQEPGFTRLPIGTTSAVQSTRCGNDIVTRCAGGGEVRKCRVRCTGVNDPSRGVSQLEGMEVWTIRIGSLPGGILAQQRQIPGQERHERQTEEKSIHPSSRLTFRWGP